MWALHGSIILVVRCGGCSIYRNGCYHERSLLFFDTQFCHCARAYLQERILVTTFGRYYSLKSETPLGLRFFLRLVDHKVHHLSTRRVNDLDACMHSLKKKRYSHEGKEYIQKWSPASFISTIQYFHKHNQIQVNRSDPCPVTFCFRPNQHA